MKKILLWLIPVAAGFINGLLGTGGGIVLILCLKYVLTFQNEEESKNLFALTIASVFPMSIASAVIYALQGNLVPQDLYRYIPGAVVGGALGAVLLGKIKPVLLKKLFAGLLVFIGVRMLFFS